MEQKPIDRLSIDVLRDSLVEARAAVRSYDTKAQILGIGYIFALGVIGRIGDQIPSTTDMSIVTIIVAWLFVVFPILLFGYVLYPSRHKIVAKRGPVLDGVTTYLYVNDEAPMAYTALKNALTNSNPVNELVYEFLEVSKHRDIKKRRFLRALFSAAICFVGLFSAQLLQSYGN